MQRCSQTQDLPILPGSVALLLVKHETLVCDYASAYSLCFQKLLEFFFGLMQIDARGILIGPRGVSLFRSAAALLQRCCLHLDTCLLAIAHKVAANVSASCNLAVPSQTQPERIRRLSGQTVYSLQASFRSSHTVFVQKGSLMLPQCTTATLVLTRVGFCPATRKLAPIHAQRSQHVGAWHENLKEELFGASVY